MQYSNYSRSRHQSSKSF